MSKRPTRKDLAEAAGVSVPTVDRVLNNRHKVKQSTAQRVLMAAEDIGYHAASLIRRRIRESEPKRTLHFLLQKEESHFYHTLGRALDEAVLAYPNTNAHPVIEFVNELAPRVIAERLRAAAETADAIAVVTIDHALVNKAVEEVDARGIPVFCLLSGIQTPSRAGYLGVNCHKRGRIAAWAISKLSRKPGQVGILLGTPRYLSQEISEISFRSFFREHAPAFTVKEPFIDLEANDLTYESTLTLLSSTPDLVGIVNFGGGLEGLVQALRDEIETSRNIVTVFNELVPATEQSMGDHIGDLIVATPIERLADQAVHAMMDVLAHPSNKGIMEVVLSPDLYLPESF